MLVGLTVAFYVALKATNALPFVVRAMGVLLTVELAQGLLGFTQYVSDLPVILVGLHLVAACLVQVTVVQAVLALRDRGPLRLSVDVYPPRAADRRHDVPLRSARGTRR